jgi:Flp pilus assembly protein TadB
MPMLSFDDLLFLVACAIAGILILGVELTLAAPKVVGAIVAVWCAFILIDWLFRRLKRSLKLRRDAGRRY